MTASPWLDESELRVGLGCMRLSTDVDRDETRALDTIAAAARAGITVFDTARSYALDETELGHNERLVARALREAEATESARIVTKGGMARARGQWVPDGRARTVRADCEASLVALDGLPIDLYLLHAPDSRTPWATSVRALARLVDDGLVARVGVSNVNLPQLDEALGLAPVAAVQVAVSILDERALRGGILERCEAAGIALVAHSPLGGPRRAASLVRREPLVAVAASKSATPAEIALAWLLDLAPNVVAVVGARRPESARSVARAARITLTDPDRALLSARPARPARRLRSRGDATSEVVLVMGIPGAGKSRVAEDYVARGYERLNRDERGGTLRALAEALDGALASGVPRAVLDNTYLTRASRSYVVEASARHRVPVRCVWLDTPLAQAQVNLVERLLDRFERLPEPEELASLARSEPGVMAPTSQMRALRELEPPAVDEGFVEVERARVERAPSGRGSVGVLVAAAVLREPGWEDALADGDPARPHLLFDWSSGDAPDDLADLAQRLRTRVGGAVDVGLCPHGGGPPRCWCRPPLPGLPLAFARAHDVDLARSLVLGASPAHRTLANALGARFSQP